MNTKKLLGYGTFAVIMAIAFAALFLTGCDNPAGGGNNDITYTAVQTGGTAGTADSTGIVFTFSASIDDLGLTADDIEVDGTTAQATKGVGVTTLSGSGASWTLPITVTHAGNVTVKITKDGIEAKTKTVAVYKASGTTDITYTLEQVGGEDGETNSTGIEFTFSASVDSLGLTADNITVDGAAAKGANAALTGTGLTRTLPITVNSAGLATVQITKPGIEAGQKTVLVYKEGQAAPQYWSITWNLNGGAEGTGAYPEQIEKGAVLAKPSPDPTKAGNTFGGWYTNSGLTTAYNFSSTVTANLNLYAKWETVSQSTENWTITWNLNGGTAGGAYPTQIEKGAVLAKPADPTKAGNAFGGWYTNPGLTTAYDFDDTVTADLTLYAKWIEPGTPGLAYELIYVYGGDTAYSVSKGTVTSGVVVIPATYEGLPVTQIAENAFSNLTGITGITIGENIDYVVENAFSGCTGLTNIIIDTGAPLTYLGISNWGDIFPADGLTVTFKKDFRVAFNGCTRLTSVTIAEGVTTIGQGAFNGCTGLTSVTIPASVTTIGNNAFQSCSGLTSITIPASVTSIGTQAFYNCTNLKNIIIDTDQVPSVNWGNIFSANGLSVTFKKNPGDNAFLGCTTLTSVTIAEGVTSIGSDAFSECTSLTDIIIDTDQVSYWGDIFPAAGLSVTFKKNPGDNAFLGCVGLTSVTIAEGVTSIGGSVFDGCTGLTEITIPASVTSIGGNAFKGCSGLVSITIPAGVTSIGVGTFFSCTSLTGITIPAGVITIGSDAFYNCSGLTEITIPASVTTIDRNAFDSCTGLTSVTFAGTIPSSGLHSNAFFDLGDLRDKYLAAGGGQGTYTTSNPGSSATWTK